MPRTNKDNPLAEMPFLQHVAELSSCLKHSLAGIAVMSIVCYSAATELFALLTGPLSAEFSSGSFELIGTGPAEAFIVKLKVALAAGVVASSPYTFFQLWRFISPALYKEERKIAVPFVFFSTLCFLLGIVFCFYLVFPWTFRFFVGEFESIGVKPSIKIGEYLSFVVKLLLVFGFVFELPILSYFLARMRLLTHTWLIAKLRYSIVAIFVLAAILTPPDVITQLLLAFPLMFIYGICTAIAYYVNPDSPYRKSAESGEDGTAPPPPPSDTPVV